MTLRLDATQLDRLLQYALEEDLGTGDVTTEATIAPQTRATAHFLAKADGVLAGLLVAERVFALVDPAVTLTWTARDGAAITAGTRFGTAQGPARAILTAERLALNLLQRMSGIATATRQMVEAVGPHPAQILDTRKTAPGLRYLDKAAVALGGGKNHRIGLFDMILIKDNHIAAAGSIRAALYAARQYRIDQNRPTLDIEVEARTLAEVTEVLDVWAESNGNIDRILLDNMARLRPDGTLDTSMLQEAVAHIEGRIETEASGNVTLATVPAIAATGVDFISSGALTHSVTALDLSMKIQLDNS